MSCQKKPGAGAGISYAAAVAKMSEPHFAISLIQQDERFCASLQVSGKAQLGSPERNIFVNLTCIGFQQGKYLTVLAVFPNPRF